MWRQLRGCFVTHEDLVGRLWLADGARLLEPRLGVDQRARSLRSGVIFEDHRTEPVDDGALDVDGTGRCAVHHRTQRRQIVLAPHVGGQGQQTVEHRGHHVGVRHPVRLDEVQRRFGIPALHHHDTDTADQTARAVTYRAGAA